MTKMRELYKIVVNTIDSGPQSVSNLIDYAAAEDFLRKCRRMNVTIEDAFRDELAAAKRKIDTAEAERRLIVDKIRSFAGQLDKASAEMQQKMDNYRRKRIAPKLDLEATAETQMPSEVRRRKIISESA